jgi:hypothetical protein
MKFVLVNQISMSELAK